jgi:diguanylate cyclase (GGDEF)-like protein
MPRLQPSFRGRLRLFFAMIVFIPLIAVAVVLFQLLDASNASRLDSRLSEAQTGALGLYVEARGQATRAARAAEEDVALASALHDRSAPKVRDSLVRLARRIGAARIRLDVAGLGTFETGRPTAMAPAVAQVQNDSGVTIGRLTVSTTGAREYANRVKRVLKADARVDQGGGVVATTLPSAADVSLPGRRGAQVRIGDAEYRTSAFNGTSVDRQRVTVHLLVPVPHRGLTRATAAVIGLTVGFLVLAFVFAVTVSRTLQSEVQRLLQAAQRLGRGDFSVTVPAEGNDEFAALGKEFNDMARQLEARLEDLRRERGRLQEAIRRVGESFARGLDRHGVLEIVVQTAVDGVGAASGRATLRNPDGTTEEITRTGAPDAYERALHAAELAAMDAGTVAEIQIGSASALAAPLAATEDGSQLAIVSVARGDRSFTPQERELFSYLTSQAAVSVENVDLHETVQRQAVTDELTGLFNHRRFQEVMSAEVERARRYDQEMGLIMLDIDNFKQVNDTYGHVQGDMVLREVARVLRHSARDVDEPARYGGEEMAVALPQTDLDGAYRFAERVRKRIEALELPAQDGNGRKIKVTASFGAASLATAGRPDKEGLVAAADAALYRAKRSGKNRTVKAE